VSLGRGAVGRPEKLTAEHDTSAFSSGEPSLDEWLKRRALKSQRSGAARTYVALADNRVIGYYCLAVGSVDRDEAVGRVRRNMPDPVPVMLLARLAVDSHWQGAGIGHGLLQDAIYRTRQAADIAGIRAMLVHAISEDAKRFYGYFGFRPSVVDDMTLMVTLDDLKHALS